MYLVSACLAGINCRYDGKNSKNEIVSQLVNQGKAIPVCPELLGGLQIPRICCEIITDEKGERKVLSKDGQDLTKEFMQGAEKTLKIAQIVGIKRAVLKAKSPSCGCGVIYDGSFKGQLKKGNGLTTQLLIKNGISVFTENDVKELTTLIKSEG